MKLYLFSIQIKLSFIFSVVGGQGEGLGMIQYGFFGYCDFYCVVIFVLCVLKIENLLVIIGVENEYLIF